MMQSSRVLGADADAGIILNIVTDSVLLADAQWIVVYANPSTNLLLELEDLHADAERKRAEGAGRREDPQGNHRLAFVSDQRRGLDYLSLDRSAETISGGEAQRIRLASQIGSGLTGVMYVLDEPSIGLHQRDNARLLETLTHLRDLGNTVIVVEHDLEAIEAADYVVDMGPGAGEHGGHVVAEGTPAQVAVSSASLIGAFLSGRREIVLPARRTPPNALRELRIREASGNNLKRVDLQIPVAC